MTAAKSSLSDAERSLESTRQSLSDLSNKFGPQGEWKKLESLSLDKNLGEYTYELCFFGKVTQKSNKGGGSNDLG
jgi:protein kinase C substrate 80K-H